MSALEDNLLRRIKTYDKAQARLERKAAKSLFELYEEARMETLQELIHKWGHLEKFELGQIERTMQEIERLMAPYSRKAADLRSDNIAAAWQAGQQLVWDTLTMDTTIATPMAHLQVRLGLVDKGMVHNLFGDMPKLAGRVTDDVLTRIRNELVKSAVRGESIPKMANRVAGTGLTQEGLRKPFKSVKARATTIARTETIKASDAGYEDMVSRAESVIQETIYDLWLVAYDERNETGCQCRAIGKGDAGWKCVPGYPGVYKRGEGPRPVIDTHPNCRCRRVPILLSWLKSGLVSLPALTQAA